jgi:CBS-domain-containing membrane protein
MRRDIASVSPDMDAYEAIDLLLTHHVSALPVVDEEGYLVGILSERVCLEAFVSAEYYESPPQLVRDLMTEEVVSVTHDTDIMKVAALFSEKKFHHFPVLQNGLLVGQISRRGVIRALQEMRRAG